MNTYPDCQIFNLKHPDRKTVQEELNETITKSYENHNNGNRFLGIVKEYVSNFPLPDTCVIIRKNNKQEIGRAHV